MGVLRGRGRHIVPRRAGHVKTFKRIRLVERTYESDHITAQRVARRYEQFDDHRKFCVQCKGADVNHPRCYEGQGLFKLVQAATEKQYEEVEVDERG
jgi:translation initiation factor IF-3